MISIYKQPAMKLNPYTGEPMKKEYIPFQERQVNLQVMKKYLTSTLNDFTKKIYNKKDYEVYI